MELAADQPPVTGLTNDLDFASNNGFEDDPIEELMKHPERYYPKDNKVPMWTWYTEAIIDALNGRFPEGLIATVRSHQQADPSAAVGQAPAQTPSSAQTAIPEQRVKFRQSAALQSVASPQGANLVNVAESLQAAASPVPQPNAPVPNARPASAAPQVPLVPSAAVDAKPVDDVTANQIKSNSSGFSAVSCAKATPIVKQAMLKPVIPTQSTQFKKNLLSGISQQPSAPQSTAATVPKMPTSKTSTGGGFKLRQSTALQTALNALDQKSALANLKISVEGEKRSVQSVSPSVPAEVTRSLTPLAETPREREIAEQMSTMDSIEAEIVWNESPDLFVILPSKFSDLELYNRAMLEESDVAARPCVPKTEVRLDEMYALYTGDRWHRVLAKRAPGSTRLVAYSLEDTKYYRQVDQLKSLEGIQVSREAFVYRCQLGSVRPQNTNSWISQAVELYKERVKTARSIVIPELADPAWPPLDERGHPQVIFKVHDVILDGESLVEQLITCEFAVYR